FRPADAPERVDPEKEIERAERLDELDPGQILPEARDHKIPPLAELGHHPSDILLHPVVSQRRGGGHLSGVIRSRRGVRLQRRHRLRDGPRCERWRRDRKSTRLNSSHRTISYAVFCLKKKKKTPKKET